MTPLERLRALYDDDPLRVFEAFGLANDPVREGDEIHLRGSSGLKVNPEKRAWMQHGSGFGGHLLEALAFAIHGDPNRKQGSDFTAICQRVGVSTKPDDEPAPYPCAPSSRPAPERRAMPATTTKRVAPAPPPLKAETGFRIWNDEALLEDELTNLTSLRDHPAFSEFRRRYPHIPESVYPDDWKFLPAGAVRLHDGSTPPGVVYPGVDPEGRRAVKWKSLVPRPIKRDSRPLFGSSESALLYLLEDRPLVIVGGEEKSLSAYAAGFSVLCPMMGERASEHWAHHVATVLRPHRVILANDNDAAGARANRAYADLLTKYGMPESSVFIVRWPDDLPKGADLCDLARSDDVRELLEESLPLPAIRAIDECPPIPTLDLAQLFLIQPDFRDLILGDADNSYLCRGELGIIAGQPGVGKSRVVAQLIFDILLGRGSFLGTIPIANSDMRILLLQDENSIRRLQSDFACQTENVDSSEVSRVARFLRMNDPRVTHDFSLGNDDATRALRSTIASINPHLILADPWASFFDGESENDAAAVNRSLKLLRSLASIVSPHVAIVMVHHARTGREAAAAGEGWDAGAFARGSKALTGKARTVINVMPGGEDFPSHLVVACGKANNARDPFRTFGATSVGRGMLARDDGFDVEAWRESARQTKPKKSSQKSSNPYNDDTTAVLDALASGGKSLSALANHAGITMARAQAVVESLHARGRLTRNGDIWFS